MVLDAQVARFATMCKLDPKVEEWLVKEGILDCEGVASLAAKEDMVDTKVIQVLIASGIEEMKVVRQADRPYKVLEEMPHGFRRSGTSGKGAGEA